MARPQARRSGHARTTGNKCKQGGAPVRTSTRCRPHRAKTLRALADGPGLLHDFKINPLSSHAMLLARLLVVDDDLKDVLARRQISTELNHAAGQHSS